MEKYQNKYRIQSARLQNWDYGWNGYYFVTLCSAGRRCVFGKITSNKMILSEIGQLVDRFWFEIPLHFDFIELDTFIVMPNHIQGILVIDKDNNEGYDISSIGKIRIHNQGKKTLSSVVGSFKSVISKHAHLINPEFEWQERFYDSIIRTDTSYQTIRNYILNNPVNWKTDKFFFG